MRLEQTIAGALPAHEVRLESFEHYDDALSFCKAKKTVGLLMLLADDIEYPLGDLQKNLGSAYTATTGLPCLAVLIGESARGLAGYAAVATNDYFLDYLTVADAFQAAKIKHTMTSIWQNYILRVEAEIIPIPLARTLVALSEAAGLASTSMRFMERVSNLLAAKLNISWLEFLSLRWIHVIETLEQVNSPAYTANPSFAWLANFARTDRTLPPNLIEIVASPIDLAGKLSTFCHVADKLRLNGGLEPALRHIKDQTKPASPGFMRIVAAESSAINSIAQQESAAAPWSNSAVQTAS